MSNDIIETIVLKSVHQFTELKVA